MDPDFSPHSLPKPPGRLSVVPFFSLRPPLIRRAMPLVSTGGTACACEVLPWLSRTTLVGAEALSVVRQPAPILRETLFLLALGADTGKMPIFAVAPGDKNASGGD